MGRLGRVVWVIAVALAVAPAAACAATITFVAPPGARAYADPNGFGPAGYTEAPTALRTTDTRPTIGIVADAGAQLLCHYDDVHATQPCGAPAPGCAALCGSFQPAAPAGPDSNEFTRSHFLAVDLMDADGNVLASTWLNIDVDTTAPVTEVDSEHGVLTTKESG